MNRKDHLLILAMEECSEIAQRCSKALRFGLGEVQPGQELSNAERIRQEWYDLCAVMELLALGGASICTVMKLASWSR